MATKPKRHRGTAKRIRLSSTGKILHRRPYANHFLSKKRGSRKRGFAHYHDLDDSMHRIAKRLLRGN